MDGTGTPVEWAVEMTRFDEGQTLDILAASTTSIGRLRPPGRYIVRSHHKAPRADGEGWIASISNHRPQYRKIPYRART